MRIVFLLVSAVAACGLQSRYSSPKTAMDLYLHVMQHAMGCHLAAHREYCVTQLDYFPS